MPAPRRSTLLSAVVVAALLGASALLWPRPPVSGPPAGTAAATPVRLATVEEIALARVARATGFLRARHEVTIRAERPGRVVALPVPEGGPVRAGEVVARLDDAIATARLREARAAAREAALDPHAKPEDLERLPALLDAAAHELALYHPASPFDGVVEVHHAEVGGYVAAGGALVDVIDPRVLELEVEVDAEVVPHVLPGAFVEVEVPALGEAGRLSGRVARVGARANATTRRFPVVAEVESGPTAGARPGMHAEARLPLPPRPPSLYLPKAAARSVLGETGVFAAREGVARWVPVVVEEVETRADIWRVVAGALRTGDRVVVSGFQGLRDGTPVEAAER